MCNTELGPVDVIVVALQRYQPGQCPLYDVCQRNVHMLLHTAGDTMPCNVPSDAHPYAFTLCPLACPAGSPVASPQLQWTASRKALEVLVVREEQFSRTNQVGRAAHRARLEGLDQESGTGAHTGRDRGAELRAWNEKGTMEKMHTGTPTSSLLLLDCRIS